MIGYLRGEVSRLFADSCFLDVGGVGYRVFIAAPTRDKLTLHCETMLYTYLQVRDDAMTLYGFATLDEYDVFSKLISISGIGPKVALGVLSAATAAELCRAVNQKDTAFLTKLPGIGKKTAERLVLELHDTLRFTTDEILNPSVEPENFGGVVSETAQALLALGYTQAEFAPYLKEFASAKSPEEALKKILRKFAGRRPS